MSLRGKLSKQVFVEQLVNPEYVKLNKPWGVVFQTKELFRVPKVGYAHFQLLFVLCLWSRLTDFVNTAPQRSNVRYRQLKCFAIDRLSLSRNFCRSFEHLWAFQPLRKKLSYLEKIDIHLGNIVRAASVRKSSIQVF